MYKFKTNCILIISFVTVHFYIIATSKTQQNSSRLTLKLRNLWLHPNNKKAETRTVNTAKKKPWQLAGRSLPPRLAGASIIFTKIYLELQKKKISKLEVIFVVYRPVLGLFTGIPHYQLELHCLDSWYPGQVDRTNYRMICPPISPMGPLKYAEDEAGAGTWACGKEAGVAGKVPIFFNSNWAIFDLPSARIRL